MRIRIQLCDGTALVPASAPPGTAASPEYVVTPHILGGVRNQTAPRHRRTVSARLRRGVVTHVATGCRCSDALPWRDALRQASWWAVWGPQAIHTPHDATTWALSHRDVLALLESGLNPALLFDRPESGPLRS